MNWLGIVIIIAIGLPQTASAVNLVDVSQEAKIAQIEKKIALVVRHEQAPAVYAQVEPILDRLTASLATLEASRGSTVSQLYLLSSSDSRVEFQNYNHGLIQEHLILISTGAFERIINGALRNPALDASGMLYSFVAFQLARARVEVTLPSAPAKEKQLRAGILASQILEGAGIAGRLMLDAFQFQSGSTQQPNLFRVLFGQDLQIDLQLSSIRSFLTAHRYHTGFLPSDNGAPAVDWSSLRVGLKSLQATVLWDFQVPISLDEALTRLEALKTDRDRVSKNEVIPPQKWVLLEFHRLVVYVMDQLDRTYAEKKGNLSEDDIDHGRRLYKYFFANAAVYPKEIGDGVVGVLNLDLTAYSGASWPNTRLGHSYKRYIYESPYFRSPQHLAIVREHLKQYDGEVVSNMGVEPQSVWSDPRLINQAAGLELQVLGRMLPPDLFVQEAKPLLNRWIRNLGYSTSYEKLAADMKLEIAAYYYSAHFKELPLAKKLKEIQTFLSSHDEIFPFPFQKNFGGGQGEVNYIENDFYQSWQSLNLRARRDGWAKELVAGYREFLNEIWSLRGEIAILSVYENHHGMWKFIGQVVGVPEKEVDRSVGDAAKAVMERTQADQNHPSYSELLSYVENKSFSATWDTQVFVGWLRPELRKALERNVAPQTAEHETVYRGLVTSYVRTNKPALALKYASALKTNFAQVKSLSLGTIENAVQQSMIAAYGSGYAHIDSLKRASEADFENIVKLAMNSRASDAEKNAVLKRLTLENFDGGIFGLREAKWFESLNGPIVNLMIDRGLFASAIDFLVFLKNDVSLKDAYIPGGTFQGLRDDIAGRLTQEADALKTETEIYHFLSVLSAEEFLEAKYQKEKADPWKKGRHVEKEEESQTSKMLEVKEHILDSARKLNLDLNGRVKIFLALTETGVSQATDKYFIEKVFDDLKRAGRSNELASYVGFSVNKQNKVKQRIKSEALHVEIAQLVLEPIIAGVTIPVRSRDLNLILNQLDMMVPAAGLGKDAYLESIAWRLKVKNPDLDNMIETRKLPGVASRAAPVIVQKFEGLVTFIADLDIQTRKDFLLYLRDPENRTQPMPAPLLEALRKQVIQEELKKAKMSRAYDFSEKMAEIHAYWMRESIEASIRAMSPTEKIPLYDIVLTSGKTNLYRDPEAMSWVIHTALGYAAGSKEEKALRAFMQIVPEHERPTTFGYLLALTGKTGNVAELFKVFRAVGIQAGQLFSIFKLVDDEVAQQMEKLKDQAPPLALSEVRRVAERELSRADFARIADYNMILGSGSIKTVVQVTLTSGDLATLYLVNPNAEEQIDSNLRLGQNFINELAAHGIQSNSPLFTLLLEGLKSRMKLELRLDIETEKTAWVNASVSRFKSENKALLGNWSLEVAAPFSGATVQRSAMLFKYFRGKSVQALREELRQNPSNIVLKNKLAEVDRIIFAAAIYGLFRDGIFDPDRHTGNIIVDMATGEIRFIDFGKLEDFRGKTNGVLDRVLISQFFYALDSQNAGLLVDTFEAMSTTPMTSANRQSLKVELKSLLKNLQEASVRAYGKTPRDNNGFIQAVRTASGDPEKPSEIVLKILNTSVSHGARFEHKFLLGLFKGFLVLMGETSVLPKEASKIISEEVRRVFVANPMAFAKVKAQGFWDAIPNFLERAPEVRAQSPVAKPIPALAAPMPAATCEAAFR